jgi:hypothetical protein
VADDRTPNEQVLDSQIVWQVLLLRYSFYVRQRVLDILNGTEEDVATQIRGALATEPGLRDPSRVAELERLVQRLEAVRRRAWDQGAQLAEEELTNLSQVEIDQQHGLYGAWLASLSKPLWLVVGAAALTAPVQGRTMRAWLGDAARDDAKRIRTAIFGGVGRGLRPDTIARLVVGSARAKGTDGVTQISRNHVDTVIRTSVIHISAFTRDQFFRLNKPALALDQFVAVLDSRTTQLCRGLNSNRYPIGEGPLPPLHMGCRSIRYAVLPKWIGGPVPEPEVYESWIRRQSWAVQLELMGAARARRMRAGTFDAAKFTDYGSKAMSLEQIVAAARRLTGEKV